MLRRVSLFVAPLTQSFVRHKPSESVRHLELQDKLSKQVELLRLTNERASSLPKIRNEKGLEHFASIVKWESALQSKKRKEILHEMHKTLLEVREECASKEPMINLIASPNKR